MAFAKGEKRPPNAGRKKGSPNKTTTEVKEALQTVYNKIGGDESFALWARTEPGEFYKLYAKLLPVQVKGEHDHKGEIGMKVTVTFKDAK